MFGKVLENQWVCTILTWNRKRVLSVQNRVHFPDLGKNSVPIFPYHPCQSKPITNHPSTPPTSSTKSPTKTNPNHLKEKKKFQKQPLHNGNKTAIHFKIHSKLIKHSILTTCFLQHVAFFPNSSTT
jgi:hypothetical protein